MTAYFAEKVGETGHVYAVDISEKQLAPERR
jgi:ubiquinone/menaquinone biosynthesis C-methylase UbiE